MKLTSLPLAANTLAGVAGAFQMGGPPPMPQPKTTMAENFAWRDPFTSKTIDLYDPTCEATRTFAATQYTLHDLFEKAPAGLFNWGDGLKLFFSGREYPGGWAGLDRHMYDRNLLMMEYADMPLHVREWIEDQERADDSDGKGLFAVFDKPATAEEKIKDRVVVPHNPKDTDRELDQGRVAIFAPGALYPILPLFVANGSDCQGTDTCYPSPRKSASRPNSSHSPPHRSEQLQRGSQGRSCCGMAGPPFSAQRRRGQQGH